MSDALTPAAIGLAKDTPLERVDIPEWGGHAYIGEWTDEQHAAFEEWVASRTEVGETLRPAAFQRAAVLFGLVNEHGERIFPDTVEGEKTLRKRSGAVLKRLFRAINEKNQLLGAVDEAKKGSAADQSASSSTA